MLARLYLIGKDWSFIRALFKGVAAGVEHEMVLGQIHCRHVVDIGANRGQFALVCRKYFPDARIDSFEPLREPTARFRALFAGDEQVRLHQCAIGPREEDAIIHVSKQDDSSSLLPISSAQSTLFPNTEEKEERTVPVAPLATRLGKGEINSPALLKVDVQGYELEALKGCGALMDCFKYVYVECSFVELYEGQALTNEPIAWLQERGFRLQGIYNVTYDRRGGAIQADFLFQSDEGL